MQAPKTSSAEVPKSATSESAAPRQDDDRPSRQLVDLIPSMIAYWDKDLVCRGANRAYERWFGVPADKLLGRSIQELLGPKLFALNEPYIVAALRGEPQTFERIVPGPDGVQRHSLARYIPDVVAGQVAGFVAYVTEVTPLKLDQAKLESTIALLQEEMLRRRTAEETLRDIEQSLSLTLASIGAGMIAVDRQGAVRGMNAIAQRVTGWSEPEARGRSIWEVFRREDRPKEVEAHNPIDIMLRDNVTIERVYEVVAVSRTGLRAQLEARAALTYEPGGEVRGMLFLFRDVSQLRAAEAERTQAEERFRRVVEDAPNGLMLIDAAQTVRYANRRAEQLFGYATGQLVGVAMSELLPGAESAEDVQRALFVQDSAAGAVAPAQELMARRSDGSALPIELSSSRIEMPDGLHVLAAIVDISARKRAEAELRRSNYDLEQFAYVASHDLQEPLRMVASYAGLFERGYQGRLDDRADKYIHFLVDGAQRMQQLVRDVLAYSRVGASIVMKPVHAGAVLENALHALQGAIRSCAARIHYEPLPVVLADEAQLLQVFQNLISNSLKFRGEAPPEVSIGASRVGHEWRFAVRDNGLGISPEHADRVFEMFQRLHERARYEGTGIGLAIVKRIVEQHGGRIWLESSVGVGTTFYFTFPAAAQP